MRESDQDLRCNCHSFKELYGVQLKRKCVNLKKMYGKFVREVQVQCETFTPNA